MYATIIIKKDIKKLLDDCKKEYLAHHPEMKQVKISYNKILFEMSQYYLK